MNRHLEPQEWGTIGDCINKMHIFCANWGGTIGGNILYIKLRMSSGCFFPLSFGYFSSFWSPNYAAGYADKHIVNITKMCIEMNNMQLEFKINQIPTYEFS